MEQTLETKVKKPRNRTIMLGLIGVAMLVFAYAIARQVLIPFIAVYFCVVVITSEVEDATYLMLFLIHFSAIISYRGLTYFIFIVAAYILLVISKGLYVKGLGFLVAASVYSIIFANPNVQFEIGSLTWVIYIVLAVFICDNLERGQLRKATNYCIEGFALSTVVGLSTDMFPAMKYAMSVTHVVTDGKILNESRFEGLSGDPNFYAAFCCINISIMLFTNKKLSVRQILLLCFMVVVGFFTYSKSYILTIAVIALVYILKSGRHVVRNLFLLASVGAIFIVVEYVIDLNVLHLLLSRFEGAESANDLTTGRFNLWIQYFEYIFSNLKVIFFGDGFNSWTIYKGSHNLYIEMFFRYGFFGCILWGFVVAACVKGVRTKESGEKASVVTIIPVIVFITVYMFLGAFTHGHLGTQVALILFAMYMPDEEEENAEIEYSGAYLQRREVPDEMY